MSTDTLYVVMEIRDWYPKLCAICPTEQAAQRWIDTYFTDPDRQQLERRENYAVEEWPVEAP